MAEEIKNLSSDFDHWVKVLQIILRLVRMNPVNATLLQSFHAKFLDLDNPGFALRLYSAFITLLKPQGTSTLLLVLDSILQRGWSEVQYTYAYSLLALLQSNGENFHSGDLPKIKIDEYQPKGVDPSYIQKVKDDRKVIKGVLTTDSILTLSKILIRFLHDNLGQGNFGGVIGANPQIICKLNLANQMAAIVNLG